MEGGSGRRARKYRNQSPATSPLGKPQDPDPGPGRRVSIHPQPTRAPRDEAMALGPLRGRELAQAVAKGPTPKWGSDGMAGGTAAAALRLPRQGTDHAGPFPPLAAVRNHQGGLAVPQANQGEAMLLPLVPGREGRGGGGGGAACLRPRPWPRPRPRPLGPHAICQKSSPQVEGGPGSVDGGPGLGWNWGVA